MMKNWSVMACSLLMAYGACAQQINIRLNLSHNVFIVGEPVVAEINLSNMTRDAVILGDGAPDHILIEITRDSKYDELEPQNSSPLFPATEIAPGKSFTKSVELDKWFALYEAGKYMLRAVAVKNGMRYETQQKSFDIVPGIPLKEGIQMFVSQKHLQRNFHLVYWMRDQVNRLFLRIEDSPTGQAWDTIDLGSLSKASEPKLDISPKGEVTVIHRATQDGFIRTVLWSLPKSIEIAERNTLVDPDFSSTERVRTLYEELQKEEKKDERPWWQFW